MTLLTLDRVACAAPDGSLLFHDLTLSLDRRRVGLVGRNGSGKTTLLRTIAGELPLAAGSVVVSGRLAMLRQLPDDPNASLAEALGLQAALARLRRIEAGAPLPHDWDEADWTLPARLESAAGRAGLVFDPRRRLGTLSGGERTRLMLARLLLDEPEVLLMDEPTNNLDADGRAAVTRLLAEWKGGAIVASHDRGLLSGMDAIVELTGSGVHTVGGGWDVFVQRREDERQRAATTLETSEARLRQARREAQAEREKQERRAGRGRRIAQSGSAPKILLGAQKRRAEATTGRRYRLGEDLVAQAADAFAQARDRVDVLDPVRVTLPPCGLPAGHTVLRADGLTCEHGGRRLFGPLDLAITGPRRIAVGGANGTGKSTLLRIVAGLQEPSSGQVRQRTHRIALLDQDLALLPRTTALDAMRALNPGMSEHEAHAALAAFGFRNRWAGREVVGLSGGERVRLALAGLFSGAEPPWLLILDEPTNHLDFATVELLESALSGYDGAVLCVSHDPAFLAAIGIEATIVLGAQERD